MIESGEEEEVKNQVQTFLLRDFNRKQKKNVAVFRRCYK